jgi:hypothetical protein
MMSFLAAMMSFLAADRRVLSACQPTGAFRAAVVRKTEKGL